jgi:hypothetical protein
VASCKSVVLFINKSDLLPGTPAQVEEQAKKLYAQLITYIKKYSTQTDVRVFVGSASYGHSTHLLYSHNRYHRYTRRTIRLHCKDLGSSVRSCTQSLLIGGRSQAHCWCTHPLYTGYCRHICPCRQI